jgi:hypothetical protein
MDPEQLAGVLQALQEQIQAVQEGLQEIHAHRLGAQAVDPPALAPQSPPPKLPMPEKFDGSRSAFRGFVNQCRLVFLMQPSMYPNDSFKVGLILTLLGGPALQWATPYLESRDPILNDFEGFMSLFAHFFDDPDRVRTAESALARITQGRRPCSTYAAEFRRIAIDTAWNESAKISAFRRVFLTS